MFESSFEINSVVFAAVVGYLMGSIPFGYLIGRANGVDLREHGSGNIGATNASRVLGRKFFYIVFLLDFAKGCAPVLLAYLFSELARTHQLGDVALGDIMLSAAVGACVGHVFPLYLRFKGGKAVATGLGVLTALLPLAGLMCLGVFVLVLLVSRYVSLASITASLAAPGAFLLEYSDDVTNAPILGRFILVTVLVAMIIVRHRSNIRRLIEGTESRIKLFN